MKNEKEVLEKSDTIDAHSICCYAPATALAPFVRAVSIVKWNGEEPELFQLPNGSSTLILCLRNQASKAANQGCSDSEVVMNYLVGTRTRAVRDVVQNEPLTIAIRFNPIGAYPFFNIPLSEITDQVISLEDVWKNSWQLDDVLSPDIDNSVRLNLLQDLLQRRLLQEDKQESEPVRTVRGAIWLIERANIIPHVETLANDLGVSSRQLRRSFNTVVGISPKQFVRIARFHRVVRIIKQGVVLDWASVAAETGYYDQAHLISEFKQLAAITPTAFTKEISQRMLCM